MNDTALTIRQVKYTNRAFWRNPPQAFFTFAFPLMFLVIFTALFGNSSTCVVFAAAGKCLKNVKTSTFYVSAIGEKQRAPQAPSAIITTPQGTTTIAPGGTVAGQGPLQPAFLPFPPQLSSSIYRISPDGVPEELWTSREDVVYALGLASDGRLLAGTGNSGALLAIDGHGVFAHLAKSGSAQITGIARNSSGKVFLCTANPGKVFSIGPEYEAEGTFESRSFDAQLFSQWGRLEWWSPPPADGAKSSARSNASHANDPHIEFFAERNPGYVDGDELCCIARLTIENVTPAARRLVGPLREFEPVQL